MKRLIKPIILILLGLILGIMGIYLALFGYYKGRFVYGTYINGVYCTGMTPEKVSSELTGQMYDATATIHNGDDTYTVALNDIGVTTDYTTALNTVLGDGRQNPASWLTGLGGQRIEYQVTPSYSVDDTKLSELVWDWNLNSNANPVVVMVKGEDGYEIIDGKKDIYNEELVVNHISERLRAGELDITLDSQCMEPVEYSDSEKRLYELFDKVEVFQNLGVEFKLLESVKTLDKSEVAMLLPVDDNGLPYLDEDGNLFYDGESVFQGLNEVLTPYNSYHNHYFTTHDGRQVYLTGGNYGNEIDIKNEAALLYDAITSGVSTYKSEPEYKNRANYTGPDDIGNTYVEVSLDEQHLYYYENGKVVLESDVVTGNKSRGYDTPEGVYAVFYKQRNRTLVGETYRSFVQYWIEFYPHYGLHDASWRKAGAFGGDIYITNGSHGCVNMPTDNVAKAYDIVEKGTPVIVYSFEKSGVK